MKNEETIAIRPQRSARSEAENSNQSGTWMNAACLQFAKMPKMTPGTKHIGLPYHWYRGKVSSLEIEIHHVSLMISLETTLPSVSVAKSLRKQSFLCWGGELCSVFEREIQEKNCKTLFCG